MTSLSIAIHFLAGIGLALGASPIWLLALVPCWIRWRWVWVMVLFAVAGFLYVPQVDVGEGTHRVHVKRISRSVGPFGRGWAVTGKLDSGLPVRAYPKGKRLKGDRDYLVKGTVEKRERGYLLKGKEWEPIEGSWSIAEWRFQAKQSVDRFVKRWLKPREASFLSGLITGDFCEPDLLFDFGRLGLLHLMAVSGFHFSLLAMFLAIIIRPLFPYRVGAVVLLVFLSAYFAFIGASPSVMRAWIMAGAALLVPIVGRSIRPLDTLAVAALVVLLLDPWAALSIGFQFSFLCTGSILLFYQPCETFLRRFLSHFSTSEVSRMDLLSQHGYLFLTLARRALALMIAVNLAAVPMTLFHFHHFPLLALLFNLFMPFLVTASILFFPLIPFTLNLASNLPLTFDFQLLGQPPTWLFALYLGMAYTLVYERTCGPSFSSRGVGLFPRGRVA